MNPIKNSGSKIVDRMNVLFLTLVRYSLFMTNQILFIAIRLLMFNRCRCFFTPEFLHLPYKNFVQRREHFIKGNDGCLVI